jgi:hypothetical protein
MQSPSLSNHQGGAPTPTSSAAQNVAAAFANLNSLNGVNGSNSTLNSINNQQASNSNQSGQQQQQQQLLIPIMQNLNDDVSQYYIY